MSTTPDYDIKELGDVATITLAGTDATLGAVHRGDGGWAAVAMDFAPLGEAKTRSAAAELVVTDWRRRFEGAAVCSPTSTMALARELHRGRAHSSPVRRQRNWLCACNRDANELHRTQWLRDVVTVLGGTFPAAQE